MKWFIAILILILACLPASACNYGASYGATYSYGYSYAQPQAYFAVVPPVQTLITYAAPAQVHVVPAPVQVQYVPLAAPATTIQYSYSAPLSVSAVQYQLPLYAPVQPYFSNYGGYSLSHSFRYR